MTSRTSRRGRFRRSGLSTLTCTVPWPCGEGAALPRQQRRRVCGMSCGPCRRLACRGARCAWACTP